MAVIQHNVNADTDITKTAGAEKIAATLTSSLARPFTKKIDSVAIGASQPRSELNITIKCQFTLADISLNRRRWHSLQPNPAHFGVSSQRNGFQSLSAKFSGSNQQKAGRFRKRHGNLPAEDFICSLAQSCGRLAPEAATHSSGNITGSVEDYHSNSPGLSR